uniref:Uncharacterized protein n=1 Tax=Davidia involucrata TaxID=16924 RepID=A0A5B7BB73_DAVIN
MEEVPKMSLLRLTPTKRHRRAFNILSINLLMTPLELKMMPRKRMNRFLLPPAHSDKKKIPEEVEMSKKRKDSAKEDLAVRSSRPTSLKSPFAQTYKKRKTRDAKTSPRATQASKKQKFDDNEKWGADAMSIDKANKQEERKEGTSKSKGVPENEAVFEDKIDSVPTTSNLILLRNDQETQANLNAEPSSSNQKCDETIKESAIMLAQGTIGANKAGTSAPVSDETAKKVGIEIVSTGSSSEPSDPTPAKAVFWHGDLVDEMFIPFLDMVYAKYPTTFNDFKCTIPALRTVILEILGHAVRKLDEQPIQNFTPKDLEGLLNTVDELRRNGLAVDWLEAHVQFLLP